MDGGLASHEAVHPLVEPLTDRYRVITPDLRGSGRSRSAEFLTFDRLADDLLRWLDHLGIEAAIIGGISPGALSFHRGASASAWPWWTWRPSSPGSGDDRSGI